MNKVFIVEVKFNPGSSSAIHFDEFVKEVKASLVLNFSKGTATARTIKVREMITGEG